ncbi:MAG: M23 family metallopeptidase [Myxococcota bacterium]
MRAGACFNVVVAVGLAAPAAAAQEFDFEPPGDLVEDSGSGRDDVTVYAPSIRFPIEEGPAYANSQVHGVGGFMGPSGNECADANYSYPWRDNYCETRTWNMPLCPAGTGHQGQDIRPATCDDNTHWGVAVTDGVITNVGSFSVYLTAEDGTRYDYLHMSNVQVSTGQEVKRGDRLGYISDAFGGTPTTIHLHFNIRQSIDGLGSVFVPPYTSLVGAYQRLIDAPPTGALETLRCDEIGGWALDPLAPGVPVALTLRFSQEDTSVEGFVIADAPRDAPCDLQGVCAVGFARPAPLSLFDGTQYNVVASAEGAPLDVGALDPSLSCEPLALAGSLRSLGRGAAGEDRRGAWRLNRFWDTPPVPEADLGTLEDGPDWPPSIDIVVDADGNHFLEDDGMRRPFDVATGQAWRFDLTLATAADENQPVGAPLAARPVLLERDGELFLLDDAAPSDDGDGDSAEGDAADSGDDFNDGCGCRLAGDLVMVDDPRRPLGPRPGRPRPLGWLCAALMAFAVHRRRCCRGSSAA